MAQSEYHKAWPVLERRRVVPSISLLVMIKQIIAKRFWNRTKQPQRGLSQQVTTCVSVAKTLAWVTDVVNMVSPISLDIPALRSRGVSTHLHTHTTYAIYTYKYNVYTYTYIHTYTYQTNLVTNVSSISSWANHMVHYFTKCILIYLWLGSNLLIEVDVAGIL